MFKPQSHTVEVSDAIFSDYASLAIPVKGKIPFLRSLGLALGSNLTAEGARLFGAEEKGQVATKMGTLFLLSTINPKGVTNYKDALFSEAKSLVPAGAEVQAKELPSQLKSLKAQLKKGGTAVSKEKSLKKIDEIQKALTRNDTIPVEELTEFKKSINEARAGLYEEFGKNKTGREIAKRNLDRVSKIVDNALAEYGKINPEWESVYRSANEAHGAIEQSKKTRRFLSQLIKENPHIKYGSIAAEVALGLKAIPTLAGGYGIIKMGEVLTRIKKSPVLRRYYEGVVKSAIKEDSADAIKNLNKLDAALKKENSNGD